MSRENYYDRRKDAESRVKSVIDFVNNDRECRSVQLLRYFNEETRKACGRCDVCQRKRSNRVPYAAVEERLNSVMSEEALPMSEVLRQCSEFEESKVIDAIRYLADDGEVKVEKDGSVRKTGQ